VDGFHTVGQPAAVAAVHAMLATHVPHAVLLVGPASVGKHQLALDLAAGLLCTGATGGDRPCRACRGCRMVEHGNHPDLHRLGPTGAGGQVVIGGKEGKRGVRELVNDLALLPVEGGERIAIVREAHRMNEDAQSAFLKTLEEPPAATTLVLLVDDEEQLLPTIRSRCARIRLGTVGPRDIERLLSERDLADPPTAARLARLAGGRPGVAVAYATSPDAERIRGEISRTLIDLLGRRRSERLGSAKGLMGSAMELARLLEPADEAPETARRPKGRGRGAPVALATTPAEAAEAGAGGEPPADVPDPAEDAPGPKASAADRRRALGLLLEIWRDLARDLAYAGHGAARSMRETAMLEELEAAARTLPPDATRAALARLVRAGELLEANATPELVLDVLLIRWPVAGRAA